MAALFLLTDTFAYIGLDEKIHRVDGTDVIDKGEWLPTIAYNNMEVVKYDNMLFVALAANFNMPPTAIVDDNWSSLVFTAGAVQDTSQAYQIAVAGSNLAYSLYGTILAGAYPPDTIRCAVIDWGTTATQVNAQQMPYISDTYPTVQAALDALLYVPLQVTSFGNTVNVVEQGTSVPNTLLSWIYNKPSVVSQSIDQGIGVLNPAVRSFGDTGPWTADRVWIITASDGTATANRSTSITFRQKRYWGPQADAAITDPEIIALSSEFATNFNQARTITANAQYIYFAFPSSFGTPQFNVNGLLNTAWTLTTRSFVNASGFASSYDIWRSDNLLTGTYNITLS